MLTNVFFAVGIKYLFWYNVFVYKDSASKNFLIYDILPLSNFRTKNSKAFNTKAVFV